MFFSTESGVGRKQFDGSTTFLTYYQPLSPTKEWACEDCQEITEVNVAPKNGQNLLKIKVAKSRKRCPQNSKSCLPKLILFWQNAEVVSYELRLPSFLSAAAMNEQIQFPINNRWKNGALCSWAIINQLFTCSRPRYF